MLVRSDQFYLKKKGPCPEKKVRRFISYVHVVDISLRVMAEIEETVDDGSDCDDLVEEAYAYLVSKKYPECVSETKKRVIRRKAAKLTISVEGELLYKHKQGKEMSLEERQKFLNMNGVYLVESCREVLYAKAQVSRTLMMSGSGLVRWKTDIGESCSAALEATIDCGGVAASCSSGNGTALQSDEPQYNPALISPLQEPQYNPALISPLQELQYNPALISPLQELQYNPALISPLQEPQYNPALISPLQEPQIIDLITATPKPSTMRRMGRPLTVMQFRTPQETSVRENFD
ncbi:hypothetical protein EMCRGX_G030155 [Ephydatia muelleri]